MADRAAPMSSEEEAANAADVAASMFYREWWKPHASNKALAELRTRYDDALAEYKTAIERRVLAQQPCYRTWEKSPKCLPCPALERARDASPRLIETEWCPSCVARRAVQETSG